MVRPSPINRLARVSLRLGSNHIFPMFARFCIASLAILAIAGCSQGPKVAQISGNVKLDGKPLADALVAFQPIAVGGQTPGVGSFGWTDANGDYKLKLTGTEQT